MVDKSTVFQKSEKGADALARRDHSVAPKLRSLLIMVDGKRSFDELQQLGCMFGNTEELLTQLHDMGLVEPSHAAQRSGPASAPVPLASVNPAVSLSEAQRLAVRRLTDLMGPSAEDLCMRIESARTPTDFMTLVKRAELMLRDFGGASLASSFAQEMQAHRPA